ncbi:MAG: BrnT family toxin [Bryobacterales bacterium]|nr:BrnT family toxin [Bryobacterales bacterium]
MRFEWDVHTVGHIAFHCVARRSRGDGKTPPRHHSAAPGGREKRWRLFGRTAAGRYLVVVFTVRRKRFRTVTAR